MATGPCARTATNKEKGQKSAKTHFTQPKISLALRFGPLNLPGGPTRGSNHPGPNGRRLFRPQPPPVPHQPDIRHRATSGGRNARRSAALDLGREATYRVPGRRRRSCCRRVHSRWVHRRQQRMVGSPAAVVQARSSKNRRTNKSDQRRHTRTHCPGTGVRMQNRSTEHQIQHTSDSQRVPLASAAAAAAARLPALPSAACRSVESQRFGASSAPCGATTRAEGRPVTFLGVRGVLGGPGEPEKGPRVHSTWSRNELIKVAGPMGRARLGRASNGGAGSARGRPRPLSAALPLDRGQWLGPHGVASRPLPGNAADRRHRAVALHVESLERRAERT